MAMALVIPCKVCGSASSSGFHYGVRTCNACRAFFQRAISFDYLSYNDGQLLNKCQCMCPAGNSQIIINKLACMHCRLERCLEVGMVPKGSTAGRPSKDRLAALTALYGQNCQMTLPVRNPNLICQVEVKPTEQDTVHLIAELRHAAEKPSQVIWLYNSAAHWTDISEASAQIQAHDPLDLASKFFLGVQPSCYEASSLESRLTQLASAVRHLTNIHSIRITEFQNIENGNIIDSFVKTMNYPFKIHIIHMINFVKCLPEFNYVKSVNDRSRLVWNSHTAIRMACLSLDFDETTQEPIVEFMTPGAYHFISNLCCSTLNNKQINEQATKLWTISVEAGRSIKSAKLTVIEFGLLCALLYFDPGCTEISEKPGLQLGAQNLSELADAFISRNFVSSSSRLASLFELIRYFRTLSYQNLASIAAVTVQMLNYQPDIFVKSFEELPREAAERAIAICNNFRI